MDNFKLRTEVNVTRENTNLDYDSTILMLGSCFTTEIGAILNDYRFNVMANPFGTLYNPASILN